METAPALTELNRALSSIHEAMSILGVRPNEYNLVLSENIEYMECTEATVLAPQSCTHQRVGTVDTSASSWTAFIRAVYAEPDRGEHQLLVLIRPENWAWTSISGLALVWKTELVPAQHNWRSTSCRAWSINEVNYLAHELGHCFRLVHNEDDTNREIDLMLASPAYIDWLKPSNQSTVRHHFRPVRIREETSLRPLMEIHY